MNSFLRIEDRAGFPEGQGLVVERTFGPGIDIELTLHNQDEVQEWIGMEIIRTMNENGQGATPGNTEEQAGHYSGRVLAVVERFRAAVAAGQNVIQAMATADAETEDVQLRFRPLTDWTATVEMRLPVDEPGPGNFRQVTVQSCTEDGARLAAFNTAVHEAREWNGAGLGALPGMGGVRYEDHEDYAVTDITRVS